MDGVKMEPLLLNKWLMATWCGNRTVARNYSEGGLYVLKFEQTPLYSSASYFNLDGLGALFVGAKRTKAPRANESVWKNSSLFFDAIHSEKYVGYPICQACKICQAFYL